MHRLSGDFTGGGEREGRGIGEGYFCIYFLHLIHLGPKAEHVLPAPPDTAGPPQSPRRMEGFARGRRSLHLFSSQLPFLESISLLLQAVLSRRAQFAGPEEGLVIPLPRGPPRLPLTLGSPPCGNQDSPPMLWGLEARESGGGATGSQPG